jgi:hypothetical protein
MNADKIAAQLVMLAKALVAEKQPGRRQASVDGRMLVASAKRVMEMRNRRARVATVFEKQNYFRYAARQLVAFNVPQKAEVLSKMMKVHGFTINEDGKIAYWPFGVGGTIDYSKQPSTVGGGVSYLEMATTGVRQMDHMIQGAIEEIAKMKDLLDATARFRKGLREAAGTPEEELKETFDKELTKALAELARARMPAKLEIKKILEQTQKLCEAGSFKEAIAKSNEVDEHAFNLLKSWEGRQKVYADRAKMFRGLDNARRKRPDLFNTVLLEVMTGQKAPAAK